MTVDMGEGQVFAVPGDRNDLQDLVQQPEIVIVPAVGRADREPDTVHDHGRLGGDLLELAQGLGRDLAAPALPDGQRVGYHLDEIEPGQQGLDEGRIERFIAGPDADPRAWARSLTGGS